MEDKEIIKALERCADGSGKGIIQAAIDLINRQQAEIERLHNENEELLKAIANAYDLNCFLEASRKCVRNEAIKEFAERLKEKSRYPYGTIYVEHIDNLVKEMQKGGEQG